MPEGHTIHRLAQDQQRDFAGSRLRISSPQGRFSQEAELLDRKLLRRVEAHGKHLFYYWQGSRILHVHLGLYGRFRSHRSPPPDPEGQVRLRAIGKQCSFDLNGPNACELLAPIAAEQIRKRLGPDPLRADADPHIVWNRIRRSRAAIGSLLLNQSVIAGAGNIYRADVLFATGIHPERAGNSLTESDFNQLWATLTRLLKIGLQYNRIINRDPKDLGKPRSKMRQDERLLVYKRDQCLRCDELIETWTLAGRTIYACPRCQI
jgi:endonuclease-8